MSATPRRSCLPWRVDGLAASVFAVAMLFGPRYGFFRDEYYYLACADHLSWGYVDQPPFSIAVLAAVRAILGDSIYAVRLVPALLGAALVVMTARLARRMGGADFAQVFAALGVAVVSQYLALAGYFSMNAFDVVLWTAAALVVARIASTQGDMRSYVLLGIIVGCGLLNKLSMLFFAVGLALAFAVTKLRSELRTRGPWLAAGIAVCMFLPHVAWQYTHGFPTREFIANATRFKNVSLGPVDFVLAQISEMNPFTVPLWTGGLLWLLFAKQAAPFRGFALVFLVTLAILILNHSKPYYLGAAYPPLFAAGAILFERSIRWRWVRGLGSLVLLVSGGLVAPFALPVLPVERFIAYQDALGQRPKKSEKQALAELPQFFADRFGWLEMTAAVAETYRSLPGDERSRAMILTRNYGEAGALRYHGRSFGLPLAVSQHNSFFMWGPGEVPENVVAVVVGFNPDELRSQWSSVEPARRWVSPYAMPYEQQWPVVVCRGPKLPFAELWRRGRAYI